MKHLLNILDLSVEELDGLIAVADDMMAHPEAYEDRLKHRVLATLFFEPSTRTRLSFESAMFALGGNVLGFSSSDSSSAAKGESVADTVSVVSGYADIIAMRHPKEGAPYVASAHARVPIINAGDGGHYHPTQTLADLLTIHHEKGRFDHLKIGLCGDLKYGRTVHSLIGAMARYPGVSFVLISPEELKLPDFVKREYLSDSKIPYTQSTSLEDAIADLDVLYMTRIQKERFADPAEYERLRNSFVLTPEKLQSAKSDLCIMHPLPRVNEISVRVDSDPRACYFRQTVYGKYMRMALILKLLEDRDTPTAEETRALRRVPAGSCKNPHCILTTEQELTPMGYTDRRGIARCVYCDGALGE